MRRLSDDKLTLMWRTLVMVFVIDFVTPPDNIVGWFGAALIRIALLALGAWLLCRE